MGNMLVPAQHGDVASAPYRHKKSVYTYTVVKTEKSDIKRELFLNGNFF